MFENILNFFKNIGKKNQTEISSKDAAKERLHLVLMQDRANVSADFLDMMRQEIIEVIKKYIDVDENDIDVRLTNRTNEDGTTGAPALYANIPITGIREEIKKEKEAEKNTKEETVEKVSKQEETISEDKANSKQKNKAKTKLKSKDISKEENKIDNKGKADIKDKPETKEKKEEDKEENVSEEETKNDSTEIEKNEPTDDVNDEGKVTVTESNEE